MKYFFFFNGKLYCNSGEWATVKRLFSDRSFYMVCLGFIKILNSFCSFVDGFNQDSSLYLGISEMEKLVYKYHRRIGIPWEILGDAISYWGRDRYPCAFKMEIFENYLKNNHPDRHKFIFKR